MNSMLLWIGSILLGFLLISVASPVVQFCMSQRYRQTEHSTRHLSYSGMVLLTAIAAALGISLFSYLLNTAVVTVAFACTVALSLISASQGPTLWRIIIGTGSILASILLALFLLLMLASEGNGHRETKLEGNLYCQLSAYGFVTSDSGYDLSLFHRYLFIDSEVHHVRISQAYPNPEKFSAADKSVIEQCDQP